MRLKEPDLTPRGGSRSRIGSEASELWRLGEKIKQYGRGLGTGRYESGLRLPQRSPDERFGNASLGGHLLVKRRGEPKKMRLARELIVSSDPSY